MLLLFIFGCSKKPTEINGMAEEKKIAPSSALPFEVTTVWPDTESREMIDTKKQTTALIETKDYDHLDALAAKLRSSKESYAIGFWKLGNIYEGLSVSDDAPDSEWDNRITILKDWITAKPDSITARIAKKLYPDSTIFQKGFEETTLPNNYFDATVGNVPFG